MKKLLFLALLTIIVSCSKDDEPVINSDTNNETDPVNDSITYFTLNVNEYWLNDFYKSGFIIINSGEGKLIDYKKIENDTKYEFKAKKDEAMNKFTITRFIQIDGASDYNAVDTYYNIEQGDVWNFNGTAPNSNTVTPSNRISFDLKVENIAGWSDFDLSGVGSFSSSGGVSSIDFSTSMEENGVLMIVIHFVSKASKYVILDTIKDGDMVTINGDELLDFDSYITVNLPNDGNVYTKDLIGDYNDTMRFIPYSRVDITSTMSGNTLGLLDEFSNYVISIETSNSEKNLDYLYRYNSMSPKDINIPSIDVDFSIVNNTIDGFQLETNKSHNIKTSQWRHNVSPSLEMINLWAFHSDEQDYNKIPELPIDLLTAYPDFKAEDLEYMRTILSKGGRAYDDLFENVINDNNQDIITERFTFSNPVNRNKISKIDDLIYMIDYIL